MLVKSTKARNEEKRLLLEVEKEQVIEECRPRDNQTDRRILFEMTGRRLEQADFPGEDETD